MPDKEAAKRELKKLIARYEAAVAQGKVKQYNEERTKKDFILPLFKILGWATETEEVTAEDKVSKGRVDYGFRINELLKLVVEAKPLRADLDKPEYAQQAVDYAWHKGISWAVLTNFEKIILFNADLKLQNPLQNAKLRLSYSQFMDRFEDLWLLSKESIEGNALEAWGQRYVVGPKKVEVGEQILADLMEWREWLTKDINKHPDNKKVTSTEEELDESVQRILDRLIFIRTCEDRDFEEKLLHQLLEDWRSSSRKSLFASLVKTFEYFNENYDSKLFLPHSCDKLSIANEVLAVVVEGLYRTKDKSIRYDFSLIEADVLGSIYENYLGHVLRQTTKRVKVADTPNHRKQLGIYYTPPYIVDYIVKNTLGELLKGKKAEEIKDIKVLDPACGSGSFLIKAFDTIAKSYERKNGEELPFAKKKDVLVNNIFGVDLDPKAVEIAQLNLMMKAVEKKKLLPMLQDNVKVGNSLIDDPAVAGDKAFKWQEQFHEIMKNGGFDVVVGNPPYVNNRNLLKPEKEFFERNYTTAYKQYDIYVLFYELALKLLKNGGYLGFIAPNKFAITMYGVPLRKLLLNYRIVKIVDVSQLGVFAEASTYPYIIVVQKISQSNNKIGFYTPLSVDFKKMTLTEIKQATLNGEEPLLNLHKDEFSILEKITGENLIDIYRAKPTTKDTDEKRGISVITNREVERYNLFRGSKFIKRRSEWNIETPAILMKKICYVPTASILRTNDSIPVNTVYVLHSKREDVPLEYLLAILNSKLVGYYARKKYGTTAMRGGFIELRTFEIEQIPIKLASTHKQPVVNLVDKMLSLNKRLNEFGDRRTDERLRIEEEISKTDAEIDRLVYELYGITDEEKKIIEESLK